MTHNAWLSDADFEEIPEHDFTQDPATTDSSRTPIPRDVETRAPSARDAEPAGTALPEYVEEEIAAELSGDIPPVWFGMRWRDIPVAHQTDAWHGLRRWVDWLVKEYRLTISDVPPCWYRHTNIVAELYAAMCMEYKVWEENEPGLGPTMFWHTNLQHIILRLKTMVDDAGCAREGTHKEPVAYGDTPAHELTYDEDDWLHHVSTVRERITLDRPAQNVTYVRARIQTDNHDHIAESDPVGIKELNESEPPALSIGHVSTHGKETVLEVRWEHHNENHHLFWETSHDGRSWDLHDS